MHGGDGLLLMGKIYEAVLTKPALTRFECSHCVFSCTSVCARPMSDVQVTIFNVASWWGGDVLLLYRTVVYAAVLAVETCTQAKIYRRQLTGVDEEGDSGRNGGRSCRFG